MLRLSVSILSVLFFFLSATLAIAASYDCDRLLKRADGKRINLLWSQPQGTDAQIAALCLSRIPMIKQPSFGGTTVKGVWTITSNEVAKAVAPLASSPQYVIDIEAWSLATSLSTSERLANIAKYVTVMKTVAATTPNSAVGLYGVAPFRNWYSAISGDPSRLAQNQDWNDQLQPVADRSKALYPSLYVPLPSSKKPTISQYRVFVAVNLVEARRLAGSKPVYPVIRSRYSDEVDISADFFAQMLQANFEHSFTNAVVIWIAAEQRWDTSANWYRGLLKFLNQRAADVGGG